MLAMRMADRFYQCKVTYSLVSIHRPGQQAHNSELAYFLPGLSRTEEFSFLFVVENFSDKFYY